MAAVPGVLSYGPNLLFLHSKLGILFFLRNGVTPFCLHVCVFFLFLFFAFAVLLQSLFLVSPCFALFLCFALSLLPSLLFPSWTIYFLLILYCASCAGPINQVYIKSIFLNLLNLSLAPILVTESLAFSRIATSLGRILHRFLPPKFAHFVRLRV
jgi:hypothetical protein